MCRAAGEGVPGARPAPSCGVDRSTVASDGHGLALPMLTARATGPAATREAVPATATTGAVVWTRALGVIRRWASDRRPTPGPTGSATRPGQDRRFASSRSAACPPESVCHRAHVSSPSGHASNGFAFRDVRTRFRSQLWAVIGEAALLHGVASPSVRKGRLLHLIGQSNRPNVELQVLGLGSGLYSAAAGPFTHGGSPGGVAGGRAADVARAGRTRAVGEVAAADSSYAHSSRSSMTHVTGRPLLRGVVGSLFSKPFVDVLVVPSPPDLSGAGTRLGVDDRST
ncbi:Scr1 family TA system antitoxin-like transcriptional regulator [Embleya scabrispora]|uniref:Scr1 family TA system antitoxin-like transcriptional regulator n=1 Tax=Embleya scabrispora TaxID=159449 RepID=UPI002691227A